MMRTRGRFMTVAFRRLKCGWALKSCWGLLLVCGLSGLPTVSLAQTFRPPAVPHHHARSLFQYLVDERSPQRRCHPTLDQDGASAERARADRRAGVSLDG